MNRKQAKEEARNNTRTWGELLQLVRASSLQGMSRVNKSATKAQAANIMENMIAERDLGDVPKGERYDVFRNQYRISGDGLAIQNLLREFS